MFRTYSSQLSAFSSWQKVESRTLNAENGLTLLELIIATVLVSVLLGAIGMVYKTGFSVFYAQEGRSGIKADAGRFMAYVSNELRLTPSLTSAQAANITFSLDSDDNGVDETVSYSWNGTQGAPLQKTITSTVPAFSLFSQVINSVGNLSFSYYDANNTLLSSPVNASLASLIAINLTAVDGDETVFLRTNARIRSF